MTARLTPAEARRLGVEVPTGQGAGRTTRRSARAPYWSICCTCAATFTSEAAETRHAAMGDDWRTRHRRYATVTEAKR